MRRNWPLFFVCSAILTSQTRTFATADWRYQVGQFVPIENGLSPNQAYTVAAREDDRGSFGIFLVNARTKKNLGSLQAVAEFFDTAPAAFHAEWTPDSRHLALWYRVHRHLNRLAIYRIENDRAYSIAGPSLLLRVSPELAFVEPKIDVAFHSLKWQSSSRFLLHEEGIIRHVTTRILRAIGNFGQLDTVSAQPGGVPSANYAIDAICELAEILSFAGRETRNRTDGSNPARWVARARRVSGHFYLLGQPRRLSLVSFEENERGSNSYVSILFSSAS